MDFTKLQRTVQCSRCKREYKTLVNKDYDHKEFPYKDYNDKNNICDRDDCFAVYKKKKKGIGIKASD